MLDILEKFLIRKGYCFSRLDGSTPTASRQSLVNDFNSSPSKQVFLVSTRAGGLGLNLVSANRVVIFDPNWNPSHDLQAQDRSFRLGQKRHVVVFRLIAAGSLEELVYTRQVYKQQLSNIAVSGKMEKRYFEGVQDHKQFQGELFGISNLFRDLSDKLFTSEIIELHDKQRDEYTGQGSNCQNMCNLRMHLPSTETSKSSLSDSTVERPLDSEGATANKPLLEGVGILYSHRYEDIVNLGPGSEVSKTDVPGPDNGLKEVQLPAVRVAKQITGMNKNLSSRESKKRQFSQIAQFMGMTETEFSKWIMSAASCEREKVLRDYRKRRKGE